MIMSATEIYDRFYDKMTERQLNELLELIEDKPGSGIEPELRKTNMDYNSVKMHNMNSFTDNPFDSTVEIPAESYPLYSNLKSPLIRIGVAFCAPM